MVLTQFDILRVWNFKYDGRLVRAVTIYDGTVLFVAYDIGKNILGVRNPHDLISSTDRRSKREAIISFDEDVNPQRYILVDIEGLRSIVYRSKKSDVDKLDFIYWAVEKTKGTN
jgi:prophage antirepressor-like protein